MKILNSAPKFIVYAVLKSIRHPKTPITYYYCSACRMRFNSSEKECPKCQTKVGQSPESRIESPIPWWGSIVCIVIGIGSWIISGLFGIHGLDEAARAMVYIPLGSLFGMSVRR